MIARILTVDDEEYTVEDNERYLRRIPPKVKERLGIEDFVVHSARCGAEALDLLLSAKTEGWVYDAAFLDLNLPHNADDHHHSVDEGFLLLAETQRLGVAKMIVVVSAYARTDAITRSFNEGAMDFIVKDYDEQTFQDRFLAVWRRIIEIESDYRASAFREHRLRTLVTQAQIALKDRLAGCFSGFRSCALSEIGALEHDLCDRLALDPDSDSEDPLLRHLKTIRDGGVDSESRWREIASTVDLPQERRTEVIEERIRDIADKLEPCFIRRSISLILPEGRTEVSVFGEELLTTLTELMMGAVIDGSLQLKLEVWHESPWAYLKISDTLPPMPADHVNAVNNGQALLSDDCFSRAWGLSVLQQNLIRGGGKITLEAMPTGNIITYRLPLAEPLDGRRTAD